MQTTKKPPFGSRRARLKSVDHPPYSFDSLLKEAIESAVEAAVEARSEALLAALDQTISKALQASRQDDLKLVSVKEASSLLAVHENTIRKLLAEGAVQKQHVKGAVRISLANLRAYLDSSRQGGRA